MSRPESELLRRKAREEAENNPPAAPEKKIDKVEEVEEKVETPTPPVKEEKTDPPKQEESADISEESILEFLSKKRGQEFKTIDELFTEKVVEVEKIIEKEPEYADDTVVQLNEFIKKTGRKAEDFFKLNKDWSTESDDAIAREYLRVKKPSFSDEKVNEYLETKYKLDPEVYDPREVRLASLDYETLVSEARDFFDKEKEKYLVPVERHKEVNPLLEPWSENVSSILSDEQSLVVPIGDQKFHITDKDAVSKRYSSVESLLKDKAFADDKGNFSVSKLIKVVEAGLNADKIVKQALTDMETKIREDVMKDIPEPGNPKEPTKRVDGGNKKDLSPEDKKELLRRIGGMY